MSHLLRVISLWTFSEKRMVVIEINAPFRGRSLRYEHKKFPVESLTQYTEKKNTSFTQFSVSTVSAELSIGIAPKVIIMTPRERKYSFL